MAWLDKLQIKGIRSFSPSDEAGGVIQFQKPLTIIVGPNGTGKTTVVECLKYVTTGEMPPGVKAGQGAVFVHDPKVAHTDVRALVKLFFKDVAGKDTVVARQLKSQIKPNGKVECRSDTGTVSRRDKHGNVMTCLGVSKSILSNVVFCHQEEANWPLGEPKRLKEKFDDIFAATKYTALLKSIQDLRKEQSAEIKVLETSLHYLSQNKIKAAEMEDKKRNMEHELQIRQSKIDQIREEIGPDEEKLHSLNERMAEMQALHTKIEKLKTEARLETTKATDLKQHIESIFKGSRAELELEIEEFDSKSSDRRRKIDSLERKISEYGTELDKLHKCQSGQLQKIGSLEANAKNCAGKKVSRDEKVKNLAEKYGFSGFDRCDLEDVYVRRFMEKFQNKIQDEEFGLKIEKEKLESKETAIQNEICSVREKKASTEQTVRLSELEIQANESKIKTLQAELTESRQSAQKLSEIEHSQRTVENSLKDIEGKVDEQALENKIGAAKKEKNVSDQKIRELQKEFKIALEDSDKLRDLDNYKEDLNQKTKERKILLNRHWATLEEIFGADAVPTEKLGSRTEENKFVVEKKKNRLEEEHRKWQADLMMIDQSRTKAVSDRKSKERESREYEEKVFQATGGDDLDFKISELDKELEKLRNEKGATTGLEYIYSGYMKQIQNTSNPCCPLCHRNFEKTQDSKTVVKELGFKISNLPKAAEENSKKILEKEEARSMLLELKPIQKQREAIVQSDLPRLEEEIKSCEDQIGDLRKKIGQHRKKMDDVKNEEEKIREIGNDAIFMDKFEEDIQRLEEKISVVELSLSGGSGRSVAHIQNDIDLEQAKLSSLNAQVEKDVDELSDYRNKVVVVKSELNQLKSRKLEIQSKIQKQQQLEDNIKELKRRTGECRQTADDNRRSLQPLEDKLRKLTGDIQDVKREKGINP